MRRTLIIGKNYRMGGDFTGRIDKIVDANENTLFVIQEVYNDDGELYERHQKYPVDTGHQILKRHEDES